MNAALPTTYPQGETVCAAAISLPQVTAEANRHAPTRRHPGHAQAAAANAAPTAASANRPAPARRRDRRTAQLHRQRRERHPELPAAGPGTGGPGRGRSHPASPARSAAGRTPRAPPAASASTEPMVSATSSRQASVNAGSSAWLTPHGAHRSRGAKIFRHRPAARTLPPVPDQNTSGPAHDGQAGRGKPTAQAGRRVRIDRKRARPYDGHRRHRLGSLLAIGAKRGEEGSLTFNEDTTRS